MRFLLSVLSVQLLLVVTGDAATLLIDNFEEGPFSFFAVPDIQASETQSGLSTQNVITGERTVVLQTFPGSLPTTGDLSLTAGDDAVLLTADPNAPISGFRLEYAFGSPFDLTMSGCLNRFRIDILGSSANPNIRLNLVIGGVFFGTEGFAIDGPGTVEVAFDEFIQLGGGAPIIQDMTQVEEVRIVGQPRGSLSITSFSVVPEPSVGLLLLIGLPVAGTRRRTKPPARAGG